MIKNDLNIKIWKIANELKAGINTWDFKNFFLASLFYRYISEDFANFMKGGDDNVDYLNYPEHLISWEIRDDVIKTKGYFINPTHLFQNIVKNANNNQNLANDLRNTFDEIERSSYGYPSYYNVRDIFSDFDTESEKLGSTIEVKNARLLQILTAVAGLDFGDFEENKGATFADAFNFLLYKYSEASGTDGAWFFTPPQVSKLVAMIAVRDQKEINGIYDFSCGAGSLLLQANECFKDKNIDEGFFGQGLSFKIYNIARMAMFVNGIDYTRFNIEHADALFDPYFIKKKPFDVVVSRPPYSIEWLSDVQNLFAFDDRFSHVGVLPCKADLAFVLHALYYLSEKGRAALVCFTGSLYRGGAEQKIREHLSNCNFVETVINLPPYLFNETNTSCSILVLSKHKDNTKTQFINVKGSEFFNKAHHWKNVMTDDHITKIMSIIENQTDIAGVSVLVEKDEIQKKAYSLNVEDYI